MKKAALAACITGAVIAAGAAVFAIVPGPLVYLFVKVRYPNISRTIPQFTVCDVPADYQPYTIRGLTLSVPSDFALIKTGHGFTDPDGKTAVFVSRNDQTALADYTDPWKYYRYEEADYRRYFEAVGAPYPDPADARTEILWYCRDTLLPQDCLDLRGRNLRIFLEFADTKNGGWNMESSWKLPMDGAVAYASASENNPLTAGSYRTMTIYPDDSRCDQIFVMLRTDDTTAKRIISSARLAEEGDSTL